MSHINSFFYFDLRLKSPSELALTEGLSKYAEDAYDAAEFFNNRFRGIKQITVLDVEGVALRLMLVYERTTLEKVTAKALTIFSRYLFHERSWSRFSKEPTKLFIPTTIQQEEWYEAHQTIVEFGRDHEPNPNNPEHTKYFQWPSLWPDWAYYDYVDESEKTPVAIGYDEDENEISLVEGELTDDQLLAVLKSILATQELGTEEATASKKFTINQIKKLIAPWALFG